MKLLREYLSLLLEETKNRALVIVDVQPEYDDHLGFDVGELLLNALENYSKILVLWKWS